MPIDPLPGTQVVAPDGSRGTVVSVRGGAMVVRFVEHPDAEVPTGSLTERDGLLHLDARTYDALCSAAGAEHTQVETVALVEETLRTDVVERVSGTVRVTTRTDEHDETVSLPLQSERVRVERIERGIPVEAREAPRTEAGRTIIPVYAEELVVTKRLVLREEIHLITERETTEHTESITLRSQTAQVEREIPPESGIPASR